MKSIAVLILFISFGVLSQCIKIESQANLPGSPQYYSNPVVNDNCPDPGAFYNKEDGFYYVATTTDHDEVNDKFPIRSSPDLVNWNVVGYVFPRGFWPKWGVNSYWAPEIHKIGIHFMVYFVARDKAGILSIGVAHSTSINGPYKDLGHPLVSNATVGMIDPTYFFDEESQTPYLIWKEDGNGCNPPEKYTPIWQQKLSADGLSLVGERREILRNDPDSWEGPLVEGPWVIKHSQSNYYYLFYSANGYATPKYAMGVARSKSIDGPFEKYQYNPIVHSDSIWSGPGHCSVLPVANATVTDKEHGDFFIIYHSWVGQNILGNYPRVLMLDQIIWTSDDWPLIANSTPSNGRTVVPH